VLQNNGGDNLAISANGSFTFSTRVASGDDFAVSVLTNPSNPSQNCQVTGGGGMVGGSNVTSVSVNCATNLFTVGGQISGLSGTVVLRNNGGNDLTLDANGSFAFSTPIASGAAYDVTVATDPVTPISQTCTVSQGSGTVGGSNVTSVLVSCTTNRFNVGVTVSGLASNESVVLRNNGADDLTVSANGSFNFATQVASGQAFAVTVSTQPASPIKQTCTPTAGSGTVGSQAVNVAVQCTTDTFTIGGSISGLTGSGLVLRNNGGDNLSVAAGATSFTFSTQVASGGSYNVTVGTQPSGQTCTVTNGTGPVTNANITSVSVSCAAGGGNCQMVNGIRWCLDSQFARPCNTFCTAIGFGNPTISDTTWFNAQNDTTKCGQIGAAFGFGPGNISVASFAFACAEVVGGFFECASFSGCPASHRTQSDGGTHQAVCPCQ
jgi:ABC-type molybdate transport system substrate-binding protein